MMYPCRKCVSFRKSSLLMSILMFCSLIMTLNRLTRGSPCSRPRRRSLPNDKCPLNGNCPEIVLQKNPGLKWITIWLQSEYEPDVTYVTSIPGWKTVVVGEDDVSPTGCRYPECTYLNPARQAILAPQFAAMLPLNDPSKKNLAYLYAIRQGAEFIYDASVDVRPLHNLTRFSYGPTSGLVYTGKGEFNYHQHYGEHWVKPPGRDTQAGMDRGQTTSNDPAAYLLSDLPQPGVQIGLVGSKRTRFTSVAPTVYIGPGTYAVFGSENVLFHKHVFLGLFVFPGSTCSSLRSLVLQTLLKYTNGFVGFLNDNAQEGIRGRLWSSGELSQNLVSYLSNWRCTEMTHLHECFEQLISDLVLKEFISASDGIAVREWLNVLNSAAYDTGKISISEPLTITSKTNRPKNGIPNTNKLYNDGASFTIEGTQLSPSPHVYYLNNPDSRLYDKVSEMCDNIHFSSEQQHEFRDVALVVTFNRGFFYKNIIYVESIYRKYFPHIIYCGPDFEMFKTYVASSFPPNSSIVYVQGLEAGWAFYEECTAYAMKMNLKVKGYLQIGDDTLINTWNLKTFSRDQAWFPRNARKMNVQEKNSTRWFWWGKINGQVAIQKVFTHIESHARKPGNYLDKKFYNQFVKNQKGFTTVVSQTCDIFYIPERLKAEFLHFSDLAMKHALITEIAIPTMLLGFDDHKDITRLTGKMLWGPQRHEPELHFDPQEHYMHAFKGRHQMKKANSEQFMCHTYLPILLKEMTVRS